MEQNTLPNEQKVADLQLDPRNPRTISTHDFEALKKSITRFGDLSGIVKNRTTGVLVGGHQRIRAFQDLRNPSITITENLPEANSVGTVARGYVELGDEKFTYREVEWTEHVQHAANIAANRISGEFQLDLLAELTYELQQFDPDLVQATGQTEAEINSLMRQIGVMDEDELYTKEVEAPTYEPTNAKPEVDSLVDQTTTAKLLTEINSANIDETDKAFLRLAAQRHNVFDYGKVADFYANSSPEVQNLMENSALVIIDYKKAIGQGYVKLTDDLMRIQGDDYAE